MGDRSGGNSRKRGSNFSSAPGSNFSSAPPAPAAAGKGGFSDPPPRKGGFGAGPPRRGAPSLPPYMAAQGTSGAKLTKLIVVTESDVAKLAKKTFFSNLKGLVLGRIEADVCE